MICELCNKQINRYRELTLPLKKYHENISIKEYYDKFLKKDGEGKCYFCHNDAIFFNLSKGYHRICYSEKCLGKTRATGTYEFLMYKYNLCKDDAIKLMKERALERCVKIKTGLNNSFIKNQNFFKEKSRNCIEFWLKKGYTQEESLKMVKEIQDDIIIKTLKKRHTNKHLYLDVNPTQIKYWLKKGYNEEEAKNKLIERQKTFTLEKCIKKYGESEGYNIWSERQKKWSEKIENKYRNGDFVKFNKDMTSKPENEIFETLINKLKIHQESHYGKNQFFRTFKEVGKTFSYDFVFNNKIIEFNGDYCHCNPFFYKSEYFNKHRKMSAIEIWKHDDEKINLAKNDGFDVLIIWESDYKKNKDKIINECIDFLIRK